ncbi:MAG: hypothetical protein QGH23_01030 [Dehalococcoidia bacterium]|nr:hypothetical protein [Dehalococcoidia bacterium]
MDESFAVGIIAVSQVFPRPFLNLVDQLISYGNRFGLLDRCIELRQHWLSKLCGGDVTISYSFVNDATLASDSGIFLIGSTGASMVATSFQMALMFL